jgi:hypothetical protein
MRGKPLPKYTVILQQSVDQLHRPSLVELLLKGQEHRRVENISAEDLLKRIPRAGRMGFANSPGTPKSQPDPDNRIVFDARILQLTATPASVAFTLGAGQA